MNDALRQTVFDVWRIIAQGGWIMGAIFLAGQVGWFLILERWWTFRKLDGKPLRFLGGAGKSQIGAAQAGTAEAARAKGLFGQVARSISDARPFGQEAMVLRAKEALHGTIPELSRHLGTLAVLAGAAPLLGLAGTVMGIMETFRVITLYGAGNPSMMAGGIAQALMVTEAGLVVAFPMLICHDHLQKRADAIEDECVAGATKLIRIWSAHGPDHGLSEGSIA
ncbi:MAG: MotA/TolQ/ExbB proton channel family protein [Fibrobacteres bacterium]|nr:MotA/TolQ/ExbB proton channel family protein [Fibrobacterota bacterium]